MTKFSSPLRIEELDGTYIKLTEPFIFESDILGAVVIVPTGFICDYESIPVIKGTSKRGGLGHDYLYRKNSKPIVSRAVADKVYLELMKEAGNSWMRRIVKYYAVRICGRGCYHRLKVEASYREMR